MRYHALAVLFSALWAGAFVGVKVALTSSPPLFLMAFRFLIAGLLLLGWARVRGRRLPASWAEWRPLVVLGLLNNACYLGIMSLALRHVSAGMGAVLASTNPLMLAGAAWWFLGERLGWARAGGLTVSFAAVVWIMRRRMGASDRPEWMVAVLVGIGFLVAGTILFKRLQPRQDLVVVNGAQLLAAGLALLGPSALLEPIWTVRFTPAFLGAQAFLILGVSCVGMGIWFWLLSRGDASRASAYFFLNPVLGLFLGALLLGEPLHAQDFAGSLAVGLGIYLVQRG